MDKKKRPYQINGDCERISSKKEYTSAKEEASLIESQFHQRWIVCVVARLRHRNEICRFGSVNVDKHINVVVCGILLIKLSDLMHLVFLFFPLLEDQQKL